MKSTTAAACLAAGVLAVCAGGFAAAQQTAAHASATAAHVAVADLKNPEGKVVGTVTLETAARGVRVSVKGTGMPAGFKGFHIHAIGKCEPKSPDPKNPDKVGDFLSAGGHLGGGDASHPAHAGDMPSLLVSAAGDTELAFVTDRVSIDTLLEGDGSAFMVHAGPDNFGNIPTRYAPNGPDADTLATGDSGGRAYCGVLKPVQMPQR